MENNSEYFILKRENNKNYPLLVAEENVDYEYCKDIIENIENIKIEYSLRKPIPKKPEFVDYHPSPKSIISEKIKEMLLDFKLEKVQFIPAIIYGKNDEIYDNYFYFHIYNYIEVLDKENSKYEWLETANVASPIEKLVLRKDVLYQIPLEKRLIFRLKENHTFEIFHKKVVDKILEINPSGLRFIKVEDWNISVPFN